MIINGLALNGYYINNPVYISITDLITSKYIEITIAGAVYKLYPNLAGEVLVNLSSMIRVSIPLTQANGDYENSSITNTTHELTITVKDYKNDGTTTTTETFVKTFIRGGEFGNNNNLIATPNKTLVSSLKIPVWINKPCALYFLNDSLQVIKMPLKDVTISYFDDVHQVGIELQQTRYTDGVYLKFLNSLGGYSYWNFERTSTKLKSENIGYYVTPSIAGEQVTDMGHTLKEDITVESVVKAEYINIIKDLITSTEVYVFDDNNWVRIVLDGNSLTLNPAKKVYDVSVTYKRHNTYTPTTLI